MSAAEVPTISDPSLRPLPGTSVDPQAFIALSAAYWEKEKQKQDEVVKAFPQIGVMAVKEFTSTVLGSFLDDLDSEILKPVVWSESLPEAHPLRRTEVFVKLWSSAESFKFWELWKEDPVEGKEPNKSFGIENTYWYVIAISACDKSGKSLWASVKTPLSEQTATINDALAQALKERYDGPKGRVWTESLWEQAMIFNGIFSIQENAQIKNSETTTDSTSSAA